MYVLWLVFYCILFSAVCFFFSCIFTSTEIRNRVSLKLKDLFKSKLSRFLVLCGNLLITQSQCLKDKMFFIKDSGEICWYSVARKTLLKDKVRSCRRKVKIWHKKNMYGKNYVPINSSQEYSPSFIEGVQGSQYFRELFVCRKERT